MSKDAVWTTPSFLTLPPEYLVLSPQHFWSSGVSYHHPAASARSSDVSLQVHVFLYKVHILAPGIKMWSQMS